MSRSIKSAAEKQLISYALRYPGAWQDHPWGEIVVKVGKKIFVFFGTDEIKHLAIGFKLPLSSVPALGMPFAKPTGYGLGKAGWVTATFPLAEEPPMDLLCEWIDESYRAIAPKKLIAQLGDNPLPR
jgi:predicted DNA-binding protein (MmcQ/YjbR family)